MLHLSYQLTGRNIGHNLSALGLLSQKAELTKRTLSTSLSASITVDLTDNAALSLVVTRQEFETLNLDLFEKTLVPINSALARANSLGLDIDQVRPLLQQCHDVVADNIVGVTDRRISSNTCVGKDDRTACAPYCCDEYSRFSTSFPAESSVTPLYACSRCWFYNGR